MSYVQKRNAAEQRAWLVEHFGTQAEPPPAIRRELLARHDGIVLP